MKGTGFRHREAFCLMMYAPEKSGSGIRPEIVWNSRDGVTPFMVSSRCGAAMLQHTMFAADRFAPNHAHAGLAIGDRIFVDLTEARAREWAAKIAKRSQCRVPGETTSAAIERLAAEFMRPGAPDLVVVDAPLLKQLRSR
jgi:hypothetical protein